MKNENKNRRFAGKGYYIALIACVAAVGISGYVFVRTAQSSARETVAASAVVPGTVGQEPTPGATAKASPSVSQKPGKAQTSAATESQDSQDSAEPTVQETDLMEDAYEETMGEADLTSVVVWPVDGDVSATFSRDTLTYSQTMADWRTHEGLDIRTEPGSLVSATQDGTVTAVYEDDMLGNVVVVSHSGDLATLYANLTDSASVEVGDKVLSGEVLGQVGSSALLETAEPAHLHFEVFENGSPVDPLSYLPD